MTIPEKYKVIKVDLSIVREWLTYKHYARRVPPISHTFALYDNDNVMQGVCTYGPPARHLNNGYGCFNNELCIDTFELNRLCVNDGLPKNVLSFFVSQTLKQMQAPSCIVSYADSNNNHHGYIYQATNWLYTGQSQSGPIYFNTRTNKVVHSRTISSMFGHAIQSELPDYITFTQEEGGKHRYFMFIGNKKQINIMKRAFKYDIIQYPKGNNERYDSSYKTSDQTLLF